jgi:hypothetical protein
MQEEEKTRVKRYVWKKASPIWISSTHLDFALLKIEDDVQGRVRPIRVSKNPALLGQKVYVVCNY